MKLPKAGDRIYAKTNAELLNELLSTNYKAWMKTIYRLGDDEFIWIAALDGKVRSGWSNSWKNGQIIEHYDGDRPYPSNIEDGLNMKQRVVFEKHTGGKRYYIFRGVFRLEQGSTLTHRVLSLVKTDL